MPVMEILFHSLLAGLATLCGSLAVLAIGRQSERSLAVFLGLAAGIMAGVVALDLFPAALAYGRALVTMAGFLLGIGLLFTVDLFISGTSLTPSPVVRDRRYMLNMGYLIAVGIALHDLPEGMAIAVGWAVSGQLGWLIALAIGLHNVPEGMASTVPLKMGGLPPARILGVNLLVSICTPVGTMLGLVLVNYSRAWIGILLALAAGAMSYIVICKLVPESRRRHPNYARLGWVTGFLIVLALAAAE